MEYDINIKVTKLVEERVCVNRLIEMEKTTKKMISLLQQCSTIKSKLLIHYLQTGGCPEGLDRAKRRYYRLHAILYVVIDGVLYIRDFYGVLFRCVELDQMNNVLEEFHDGPSRGHFAPRTIALKIMRPRYYWPNLFKDAFSWVRKCDKCSLFAGKQRLVALPLHPIQVEQPFSKWGRDFIGPINPLSSTGHRWILTATDYFTKWNEVVALKDTNETSILNFYQDLVSRFGTLDSIISNNALAFIGLRIYDWSVKNFFF